MISISLSIFKDILDAINRIEEYVRGYTLDSFKTNRKTTDAVVRNLEVIGEACKKNAG